MLTKLYKGKYVLKGFGFQTEDRGDDEDVGSSGSFSQVVGYNTIDEITEKNYNSASIRATFIQDVPNTQEELFSCEDLERFFY